MNKITVSPVGAWKVGDNLFATEEEANRAAFVVACTAVVSRTEGWLENTYPCKYGITKEILIGIREHFGTLSKKQIQALIEYFASQESE